MRNRQLKHRGFTLIELLVVISIIALLIAILLPSLARAKELANRAVCSANVRSIIQSMVVYAQTNGNTFPCVPGNSAAGVYTNPITPVADASAGTYLSSASTTGYYSTKPIAPGDALDCLWILVLENQITPKSFICPSDPSAGAPSLQYVASSTNVPPYVYSEFNQSSGAISTGQGESYSVAFPFSDLANYAGAAPWWNANQGSDVPLVSDMAPANVAGAGTSSRVTSTALTSNTYGPYIFNSGNHEGDGQNVGFGDDHVAFETNPYVGQSQANIFCTYAIASGPSTPLPIKGAGADIFNAGADYSATAPYDIVMVPVRNVSTGAFQ